LVRVGAGEGVASANCINILGVKLAIIDTNSIKSMHWGCKTISVAFAPAPMSAIGAKRLLGRAGRHHYWGVLHSALLHCRSVLYNVRAFLAVVRWIDGDKMKDFVRVLVDATADPAT
jgi:hypothetical protein